MLRTNQTEQPVTCRRLSHRECDGIAEHLLALDFSARYDRFGRFMTDADTRAYAHALTERGSIGFGLFHGQGMIALLELLPLKGPQRRHAALTMTFSPDVPRHVFGEVLLNHAVKAARQLGFTHLLADGVGSDLMLREWIAELKGCVVSGAAVGRAISVQWIEQYHGLEHAMTGARDVTAVIALCPRAVAKRPRRPQLVGTTA